MLLIPGKLYQMSGKIKTSGLPQYPYYHGTNYYNFSDDDVLLFIKEHKKLNSVVVNVFYTKYKILYVSSFVSHLSEQFYEIKC